MENELEGVDPWTRPTVFGCGVAIPWFAALLINAFVELFVVVVVVVDNDDDDDLYSTFIEFLWMWFKKIYRKISFS